MCKLIAWVSLAYVVYVLAICVIIGYGVWKAEKSGY